MIDVHKFDSITQQDLERFRARIKILEAQDFSFIPFNNSAELIREKDLMVNFLTIIFANLETNIRKQNFTNAEGHFGTVEEQIRITQEYFGNANIDRNQIPNRTQGIIDRLKLARQAITDQFIGDINQYNVREMQAKVDKINIADVENLKNEFLNKISSTEKESALILDRMRREVVSTGATRRASTFQASRDEHQLYANIWLGILTVTILLLIIYVFSDFGISYSKILGLDEGKSLYIYLLKKVLIYSTFGIVIKMSLNKFNSERNLKILFDNRISVISQLPFFEEGISESEDKNAVRLQLAKYLFSDPSTGLVSELSNNETSISPIVNIGSKFLEAKGKT